LGKEVGVEATKVSTIQEISTNEDAKSHISGGIKETTAAL
jgi:hypothetical protein